MFKEMTLDMIKDYIRFLQRDVNANASSNQKKSLVHLTPYLMNQRNQKNEFKH